MLKELKSHPDLSRTDIRLFLAKLNQTRALIVLDYLNEIQTTELIHFGAHHEQNWLCTMWLVPI